MLICSEDQGAAGKGRAVGVLLFQPQLAWMGSSGLRPGLLELKSVSASYSVSSRTPEVGAVHAGPGHCWSLSLDSAPPTTKGSLLPSFEYPISTTTLQARHCIISIFQIRRFRLELLANLLKVLQLTSSRSTITRPQCPFS